MEYVVGFKGVKGLVLVDADDRYDAVVKAVAMKGLVGQKSITTWFYESTVRKVSPKTGGWFTKEVYEALVGKVKRVK